MESSNPKRVCAYKKTNQKLLLIYLTILILVQAVGLYFLFNNLSLNSAIIGAVLIGFLAPLFLGLIFTVYAKSLKKN